MLYTTIVKTYLLLTLLFISVNACGIGIIRIENGEWANKDSIYSNCEKCYAGDEQEIRNCKAMYNRSAEDQIIEFERQRNRALSVIPAMLKDIRKIKFTPAELCYFPVKYPDCQNAKDTLDMVLNLKNNTIEKLDAKTLSKYEAFLMSLKERKKDINQFQSLLLTRPTELSAKNVTISFMDIIAYEQVEGGIVNSDHWLYLFAKFSSIVDGCQDYETFKNIAESNALFNAIFISQKEFGQHRRIVNGGNSDSEVTYPSVKKGIAACLLLKGEEEKIAYGNDFLYDQSIANTVQTLTLLYEKEVLGAVTDKERKEKEKEFHTELGLSYVNPIIKNLKKYNRHTSHEMKFGIQTGEMFLKLKRIYNLN